MMDNAVFEDLATQVDELLKQMEQLRMENQSLRTRLAQSAKECYDLQQKNQQAVTKVKQTITLLKNALVE